MLVGEEAGVCLLSGSEKLDASIALAVRFRFDGRDRLENTLDAIDAELGAGPYHYPYSEVSAEEGCFLACTFWMIEARALLGQRDRAEAAPSAITTALERGVGIMTEIADPDTGAFLGNLPQGLSHLAHVMAFDVLTQQAPCLRRSAQTSPIAFTIIRFARKNGRCPST